MIDLQDVDMVGSRCLQDEDMVSSRYVYTFKVFKIFMVHSC